MGGQSPPNDGLSSRKDGLERCKSKLCHTTWGAGYRNRSSYWDGVVKKKGGEKKIEKKVRGASKMASQKRKKTTHEGESERNGLC